MADRGRGAARGNPRGGPGGGGGNFRGGRHDLSKYVNERIRVKFTGGREVNGILKGYDQLLNLVLDEVEEQLLEPEPHTRSLGLTRIRSWLRSNALLHHQNTYSNAWASLVMYSYALPANSKNYASVPYVFVFDFNGKRV
ncbi:U6 snRNA-associated Sm-like protein LSm7 [Mycena sanguinolenta]|uniref:U6 snRNA-associated Sm-like protein LSm7 n=1 Tax=Mycena sanguinolenta TaxID=230812 RepID=A0A8H6TUN4_9AGAR|nr:U6 snRNA-associated Sm-like protein LSm7 [Mycena sanguinolenta]